MQPETKITNDKLAKLADIKAIALIYRRRIEESLRTHRDHKNMKNELPRTEYEYVKGIVRGGVIAYNVIVVNEMVLRLDSDWAESDSLIVAIEWNSVLGELTKIMDDFDSRVNRMCYEMMHKRVVDD